MALFGSVSSKQVDEFAKMLAQELGKRYPPALDKGSECRISQKRLSTLLQETFDRAVEFKLNGHVDPDLFDVFMWEKVYAKYGQQYMDAHQVDEVDLSKIPGYVPPPAQ